jgi:ACT domain-containing protein
MNRPEISRKEEKAGRKKRETIREVFWIDKNLIETLRELREQKGIIITRFVEQAIAEKLEREGIKIKGKEGGANE